MIGAICLAVFLALVTGARILIGLLSGPRPSQCERLPPATARAVRITRKRQRADIRPALARPTHHHGDSDDR